jgi:DNA-binding transcriptional ArsR family regulator
MPPGTVNDLLVALKHPLRRAILQTMDGEEMISPRELADQLEEPLSNISYHVRVLNEYGAVEQVGEAPARGSLQHFYRMDIEEPWALAVLGLTEQEGDGDG